MVALDQMDGGGLDPKFVAGLLASTEPGLKETASWIVGRHRDWAGALAGVLGERLIRTDLPAGRASRAGAATGPVRAGGADPASSWPLGCATPRPRWPRGGAACRPWPGRDLKREAVPPSWVDARWRTCSKATARDAELIPPAVATARALPLTRGQGRRASRPPAPDRRRRQEPGRAPARARWPPCPGDWPIPMQSLFTFLLDQLDRDQTGGDPNDRGRRPGAGQAHHRAARPPGRCAADRRAGGGRPPAGRLRAVDRRGARPEAGRRPSPSRRPFSSLRVDAVKAHLAKYGPAVQKQAEALYAKLNVDAAKQKARLEQLMATLSAGDVRRGQLVFHSEKAACYSCHAIGYRGGNVGPDLTKIGSVRAERDLLEAIVFPSASFVRSFEPIAVATSDGKVYNGLLRGETADELILATGVNQEARIARREIEEMRPSTVSVMPAGLDQQLTPQELADLVAFLKACK